MSKAAQTSTAGRTAHTPGPWSVNGELREVAEASGHKLMLYCADIVLAEDDPRGWRGYIASVQSADHCANGITREEAEANARLLAAAPDLFEALKLMLCELSACANQLTDLGRYVPVNGSVNRAIMAGHAALAAAKTGGAQ